MRTDFTAPPVLAAAMAITLAAAARAEIDAGLSLGWDSRYITEGRDNLARGGIAYVDVHAGTAGWTLGTWVAKGDRSGYVDANACLKYARTFRRIDAWVSATRLAATRFALLDEAGGADYDNEFAVGFAYPGPAQIVPGAAWVYSTSADGGYLALASERPVSLDHLNLTLTPFVELAFDFGYASAEHHGVNNLQTGVRMDWDPRPDTTVTVSLQHSFALRDVRREGGSDHTWLSVVLSHQL